MYPRTLNPADGHTPSEEKVFDALRDGLPDDWHVLHSVGWEERGGDRSRGRTPRCGARQAQAARRGGDRDAARTARAAGGNPDNARGPVRGGGRGTRAPDPGAVDADEPLRASAPDGDHRLRR